MKKLIIALLIAAILALGGYAIYSWKSGKLERNPHFACGNGRIEATEINIAARLAGKVEKVCVLEGEKVNAGQVVVLMQTNVLVANLKQAEAALAKAKADKEACVSREANARRRYERHKAMVEKDVTSEQEFENTQELWDSAKADLKRAEADILAAEAEIARIKADIDDSVLSAPVAGRVQYRVAEPGEVLPAGGRAINMIDLSDVYMTFFLPENSVGKVKVGAEVRIVVDAFPLFPVPAHVTYVADVAQFTPKTVETKEERQKLMFRIKAHVDRDFLEKYCDLVKTGLPGVAWVKLDDNEPWPEELQPSAEALARADEICKMLREQPEVRDVQHSETRDLTDRKLLDVGAQRARLAGKELTKAELVEISADAAVQYDASKQPHVEQVVQQAQQRNAAAQPATEAAVQAAVGADQSAAQAPARREVK